MSAAQHGHSQPLTTSSSSSSSSTSSSTSISSTVTTGTPTVPSMDTRLLLWEMFRSLHPRPLGERLRLPPRQDSDASNHGRWSGHWNRGSPDVPSLHRRSRSGSPVRRDDDQRPWRRDSRRRGDTSARRASRSPGVDRRADAPSRNTGPRRVSRSRSPTRGHATQRRDEAPARVPSPRRRRDDSPRRSDIDIPPSHGGAAP